MARRLFATRLFGRTITTGTWVIGALSGMLVLPAAGSARAQWGDEPVSSVLVDGGASLGDEVVAEPGSGVGGVVVGDAPDGFGDQGLYSFGGGCSCTGAGCDQCRRSALIDHCGHGRQGCWIGRVDALILWRNAPPDRPLVDNALVNGPLLNADGMDSTAAAGPRFSLFRVNNCTGHAIEATYLQAANFRSIRPLSEVSEPYVLSAPGIYGNEDLTFDSGNANLGSRLQSFEFNRHHCHGRFVRFLAGFRWIGWQEQFSMQNTSIGGIEDLYQTNCVNDLYGGQIGLDANLVATPWIRFDGVVKAGAYYNNAAQTSRYTTNDPFNEGTARVRVGESPLSGAFAGELGFTGVMPLTRCIDFRFGYFGLWLSGIAQPTQQLSGQQLIPGEPAEGSINANGGVLVQGVSLGLEGRW